MRQNQVDPEFVASNNNSDPGSPTINEERSESLIEHSSLSISIASLFPPYIVQNPTKHLKCHSSHQPGAMSTVLGYAGNSDSVKQFCFH
nr:hypothetical protein CFP56_68450 [Quercus suber]